MAIPPDTRAPGDDHHVEDHNAISDVLTALTAADALATQKPLAAEAVYYVSAAASASDSNDGLTVRSAKATIAGALTAAGAAAAKIIVGCGTFTIAAADSNGNAVTLPYTGTILQGQGADRTLLNVSAAVTFGIQAQAAYCEVRDLAVQATTGGTITYGVAVDTPGSTGSAEHCAFRDILVQPVSSGTVTNCFAVAPSHTGSSSVDVAETKFTRCIAVGAANASYLLGNGTSGNILNTTLRDCYSSSAAYGVYAVGTTFTWTGGTVQKSSTTDFYLSATKRVDIGGFRSENSAKFLVSPAVGGTNQVALRDIIWIGGDGLSGHPAQAAAGDFINYAQGGALILENIQIQAVAGSGVAPCFILASGGDGLQPLAVVATGLAAEAPVSQLFSIANGKPCTVSVSGYVQLDNATGYAIPSTTPAGPLVLVPSAATHTFNGTVRAVMAIGSPWALDTAAGDIKPTGTAAAAGAAGKPADASHVHVQSFSGMFGTGSDGSATLDGTAAVAWASKSGSVYTMTRDCLCANLTVNSGATLNTAGCRIFAAGTVTNAGTVQNTGANAAGATAGAPGTNFSLSAGAAGGAGGTGVGASGNVPTNGGKAGCGTAGAGGAGGTGAAGTGGGSGNVVAPLLVPQPALTGSYNLTTTIRAVSGAAGGGGGGGDGTNAGGGGGAGGGPVVIFAWAVVNTGTLSVAGGNGANGVAGNAGGGGGGGGGVILAYTLAAWTAGTTSAAGGTHGNGVGTGVNGSDGTPGTVNNIVIT